MSTTQFSSEVLNTLERVLAERGTFATQTQLDKAVADVLKRTEERMSVLANGKRKHTFSLSTMIRGMRSVRGETMTAATAEADVAYLRALSTGGAPGSYLVPTLQAEEIIQYLNQGGVARSMGTRVWPMDGIQKMNVPAATASPSWIWAAQNSALTPSDPNLGQMPFVLNERRCLIAIPNQLLAVSVPAYDVILSELIGLGAAEHEDVAFFASSQVTGGPVPFMANGSISVINANNGNANGGNLLYGDITAVLAKAAAVKAKGPFAWAMSPRTFYTRVLGMMDAQSRPLAIPSMVAGLAGAVNYNLMGWPVFVTWTISETEAVGSGTNQSHILFTNPKYMHIAQDGNIEMAVSTERYFDAAQTAVRAVQHEDFGFAPAQGLVTLQGVN